MNRVLAPTLIFLFACTITFSQTNFRKSFEAEEPIAQDLDLSFEEKEVIHQQYLNSAIQKNDTLQQIYGLLFIFYDNLKKENFIEAKQLILEAKNLAKQAHNDGWLGWLNYREGIIHVRTDNEDKAIEAYERALPLCEAAGDSLCMGECYEQLSAFQALLGDYEKAKRSFDLAIPLLKKYGELKNLCTAYNNYGGLISMKGNPKEAVEYLERGINYCKSAKREKAQAKGMNNLADAYRRQGKYDIAIEGFKNCLEFNTAHGFRENLITNYMGLHICHYEKGEYKEAIEYYILRNELKDSISGIKVQEAMLDLEAKYHNKQKEYELQKSQNQILIYKNKLSKFANIVTVALLILGIWVWYFYKKKIRMELELTKNREMLDQLTQTLIRKNAGIKELNDQVLELSKIKNDEPESIEIIDFNQSILTSEDWMSFKSTFENSHRGFIMKIRQTFPTITDAEERLFILLKLKLNRYEIASILGISPETVKKTRNRLRKKLELETQDSLEGFILSF